MRYFKIGLLFLLLLPAVLAQAQDNTCPLDINSVVSLLEEARAKASDNDASEARKLLLNAAAEIDALVEGCQGDIQITEQKTIKLSDSGIDGEFTFNYPAGWLTGEEQGTFPSALIASNAAALAKTLDGSAPPPFSPGEVLIAIGTANTDTMSAADELGKSPTPADFLLKVLASAPDELGKASEPTIRTINDHPAAWVTYRDSSDYELLIMLVDMKQKSIDEREQYVLMVAITAPGELSLLEPTLEAMAATFRLKLTK